MAKDVQRGGGKMDDTRTRRATTVQSRGTTTSPQHARLASRTAWV